MLKCPKCTSESFVKSGFSHGKQRYKCRICKCFFTRSSVKGYNFKTRILAIKMYKEGLGFRSIGRILGISFQTVANWVRNLGKTIKNSIEIKAEYDVVEIDEMWHYVKKNAKNCGSGLLLIRSQNKFLIFNLEAEDLKPQSDSL